MKNREPTERWIRGFGVVGALVTALVVASVSAPRAETISGRVSKLIDGDSFRIGAVEIRLHAVDAFEGRQSCRRDGAAWDCGAAAAAKLRELTDGRNISCEKTDTDSYGRTVAICHSGEADLGAELVKAGLALAYRQYGDDYVDEEDQARGANRGAWAGEFTPPWDERHGETDGRRPQQADDAERENRDASDECEPTLIKGNINQKGDRIYHVPGSTWYDQTVIDKAQGERCFASEKEARGAGWRAPRTG